MASRNPVRTRYSCSGRAVHQSVATTLYSFGWSVSHKVMSASPDSVVVTVTWPGPVIVTGTRPSRDHAVPSRSSTLTVAASAGRMRGVHRDLNDHDGRRGPGR